MKIAINGAGVAGPTLAWWLKYYGHEPVLYEKAPHLRTGGYLIDFWGPGYDVAEKMGILPVLLPHAYHVESLKMLDHAGHAMASLRVDPLRDVLHGRFFSIARSDLSAALFAASHGVEIEFNNSIMAIDQHHDRAMVHTSRGTSRPFDLVIGADGLRSAVRSRIFGPDTSFERRLNFYVAAFTLHGYQHRDERAYISRTVVHRQVARVSLRDDRTLFLFIFRASAPAPPAVSIPDPKAFLRSVFGNMRWEVPEILAHMNEATDLYFDDVSQIVMDQWTCGRVALVGDAAACVSFLAGEGAGLAMIEAYILAGELHRAGGDYPAAFRSYQQLLQPLIAARQKSARSFAGFFAPRNAMTLFLRNIGTRLAAFPPLVRWIYARSIRDNFLLPRYSD